MPYTYRKPPFGKVLIANRGEIAVRIIRSCREMGIRSVAVYSAVDQDSLHVHLSDEAYPIGGGPPRESYLNIRNILETAKQAGVDAIHPGYGFLSENPQFAEACVNQGFVFIGPSADTLRAVGNKTAARKAAKASGVPIVPGSIAKLNGHLEASVIAETVGYPIMLKAAAGGGGRGVRIAHSMDELQQALNEAAGEAGSAFGDATLYVEKLVDPARHIEVQLLADQHGNIIHLGERDCRIQRRYQKVIEESPASSLDNAVRERLVDAAIRVAHAVGYQNAGTVEFLVDGSNFYFLEVNARLQVEHPVTELVTGIDLVAEQILIAAGRPLRIRQDDVEIRGSSVQCRIYAEDPVLNFMPSPGTIGSIREPGGPGIRVDSGIQPGSTIPLHYDGLLAKVVSWGNNRAEAINRMRRALAEFRISGISTTLPFKSFVMDSDLFLSGGFDTGFIDRVWPEWTCRAVAPPCPKPQARPEPAGDTRPVKDYREFSPWKMSARWRSWR